MLQIKNPFCSIFEIAFLFSLFLFPFQMSLYAQDSIPSVLDSAKIYSFSANFEQQGSHFLHPIDTLITNVENYDPPTRPGKYYASLGNVGLANHNQIFSPIIKSGYSFGISSFDQYRFLNDSLKYYWVGKPYTHLEYVMGYKKEQNLLVDHSQNIASWFNLGLKFHYVNSPGLYKNQQSDDKNFVIKTRFQTPNYRYIVLANYIHNKLKVEENGGIRYDTVFEENIKTDRRGFITNLSSANNQIKENSFFVKQYFKLSKRHRFRLADSAQSASLPDRINPGNISHAIRISDVSYLYQQSLSDTNGFYALTLDSLNPTYDSTHIFQIENQLSWTNADNAKDQLLTFNFALRHIYAEQWVDSVVSNFNQLIPNGMMNINLSDKLDLRVYADLVLGQTYGGDFNLKADLSLKTKFGVIKYTLHNANQEAVGFFQSYKSNHFIWDNNFKKQYFLINRFSYSYKSVFAGANIFAIQNFVFLDSLGKPKQLNKNIQILHLQLRKLIKLGNWTMDTRLNYQKASSTQAVRIPDFVGDVSVFYTKDLFKQAAIFQTGLDVSYNTSYYAMAYMPATRSFYVQNNQSVGNYFYANAFINLQIKRSRLFLKYHNLGFLAGDFRYYTVPSYPMQDGGFRFGISWMFYD